MANSERLIDAFRLTIHLSKRNAKRPLQYDDVLAIIEDEETVDAVEVVHGRWIQSEPGYRLCSHCMADVAIYSGHRNYCPNCGAKMDGDGIEKEDYC